MREKREKDESDEVFVTIDKDRCAKHFFQLNIWFVNTLRDGVISREDLANTLVSLGQQGTDQQVNFQNSWFGKLLNISRLVSISCLSSTVHFVHKFPVFLLLYILCTQQMFVRFQLWWMLLEEIPKFHWWIFKMSPGVFSANHNKCDSLHFYLVT